jgi:hypothetical protein
MDQESTKPGPIGGTKGSWRDRLGINKELPKISEEFKQTPPKGASSDHSESADDQAPLPPRHGRPVAKPAPMAPRQPAGDLGDRIRQQREAAERMAEKRVAEAKERAVQQSRPGMPPAAGSGAPPPPGQRPKFTFADEEFRQAQQEPREPQQPPPRQWTPAPHPVNSTRPVFTADKPHDKPQSGADPRARALVPPRNPPPAGAGSYRSPPHPAAPPRNRPGNYPPPSYPPQQGARQDRQWQARPQRAPQHGGYDPYRREMPPPPPQEGGFGDEDAYGRHAPPHETPRPRSPDFRGAHSRELSYVQQEGDDGLFEDEQNYSPQPPRRRAGPQEYTQAYREFEAAEEEPKKRRQAGPFILLGALLTAGVIAAGLIYFYFYQGSNGTQSQAEVPVVAEPDQPVKTEPQADSNTEEPVAVPSQTTTANAPEAQSPSQKKQIYDRILGETTLEARDQITPSEEQPVAPDGPSQGFDAEPPPLPLPPPPEGASGDQGSLPAPDGVQTSAVHTKSAPSSDLSAQASPASATVESEASSDSAEPLPVPGAQEETQPAESASAADSTASATDSTEPEPQPGAVKPKVDNALAVTPPPAPSAPAASAEPPVAAATGGGPVQIAQIPASQSVQTGGAAPVFNTAPMPDLTTETTAAKRRTPGRAGDRIVVNPNGNFNKPKPVQTAMAEPAPLATESIAQIAEQPAPQPSAPIVQSQPVVESAGEPVLQQQAALPAPAPVAAAPAAQRPQAKLSGFIIQLASHKTEADAQADYNRLLLQHGAVLGNLKYEIEQTKLNTGATFYQLHLGSFPSRQAARDMCTSLLATGERDCLVKTR